MMILILVYFVLFKKNFILFFFQRRTDFLCLCLGRRLFPLRRGVNLDIFFFFNMDLSSIGDLSIEL
jgi:hypothetical protein